MATSSVSQSYLCQYCSEAFTPRHHGTRVPHKFCGRACYFAARRAHRQDGRDRRSPRYDAWHDAVVARDVTCQGVVERNGIMERCGVTVDLHVHHIKSWVEHPAERFDPANGVLLCYDCHKTRHPTSGVGRRRTPAAPRVCRHCGVAITRAARTGLCYRHALDAYSASRAGAERHKRYSQGKTCATCGIPISDANRSGSCRHHAGPTVSRTKRARSGLSAATVDALRARYAAGGISFKALGQLYGVSTWLAWHVVRRRDVQSAVTRRP